MIFFADQAQSAKQSYLMKLQRMMADISPYEESICEAYRVQNGLEKLRSVIHLEPASVQELIDAPMNFSDKCSVLHRMRLFPAALCAAYIGTTSSALHSLHRDSCGVFGGKYLSNLCFSYEEMKVFVLHPEWCWRRSNIDPPRRSKFDPGRDAAFLSSSCG